MGLQLLSLDLAPPVPKSNGKAVPPLNLQAKSGDGILEDFLTQWHPDVLSGNLDHTKFFHHVVELAKVLTAADGSAIAFRGDHGTICRARIGQGAPPLDAVVDTSSGISKDCLEWGMSIRCEDMATDGRVDPETCRVLGIRSLAVVPIFCDRKISGILEVFSGTASNFNDHHLQRLQKLAKWVGAAESSLKNPPVPAPRPVAPPAAPSLRANVFKPNAAKPNAAQQNPVQAKPVQPKLVQPKDDKLARPILPIDVRGWNHVLLRPPPLPWHRFIASAFLHLLIVALFWGATEFAPNEIELTTQPRREARVTYYPFSQSAPPRESRNDSKQAHNVQKPQRSTRKSNLPPTDNKNAALDAQSGAKRAIAPAEALPELASNRSLHPGVGVATAISPAPDAAAGQGQGRRSQLPYLSGIAPAPDVHGGSSRRSTGLDASSVVPPAPSDVTQSRGLSRSVDVSIIPPAPALSQMSRSNGRSGRSFKSDALVVAPSPSLEAQSRLNARGRSMLPAQGAAQLVPPPASLESIGGSGGRGRGTTLTARNSDVVAPSPSLQEGVSVGGRTRAGAWGASGAQVVASSPSLDTLSKSSNKASGGRLGGLGISDSGVIPPSPSVASGAGAGRSRTAALGAAGSGVIAPSPSLGSGGGMGGGRQISSLGGTGSSVVPAPPSVQGIGGGGSGRSGKAGGFGGSGTDVVPPQPSMSAQGGGGRGSQQGMGGEGLPPSAGNSAGNSSGAGAENGNDLSASSQPNPGGNKPGDKVMPVFQDAQVKVISLAWAPPKSSYFSNFEVFIAEKWLNKNQTEVIKLVYVFLPYQRRLSEYGADNPKVRKLRVTRDPSCDESLMQISWPEGGGPNSNGKASVTPEDRKNLLPCYRTTADDYRQAVSRNP